MATSGVRDTASTVLQVVTRALRKLHVLVDGETVDDSSLANGIDAINDLIRVWGAEGVRLWLNETQSVTLASGTAAYTLSPRVLEVYQVVRRQSGNDIPVRLIAREDYSRQPDKAQSGAPLQVWVDRQRTSTVATVWPVPGATEVAGGMTLRFDVKRQVEDVTAGSENIEFPPEWIGALTWNVAVQLAPEYGKDVSPQVAAMAASSYDLLSGQDREGSVIMRARRR